MMKSRLVARRSANGLWGAADAKETPKPMRPRRPEKRKKQTSRRLSVGYGRPPRETQFKSGNRANPHGRRKGSKNTATLAREALERPIVVTLNGVQRKMTARQLAYRKIADKAVMGDQKAFAFLLMLAGAPYMPNWHIDAIAHRLDQIRRGEINRLMINMPPRSLKSIIGSVALPAFVLGHDPTKRIISVCYANELP